MDKNELEKINSFTRRNFTEKELYTFPVTLCDNDIDRDGEVFTDEALEQMKSLFVGKTGIFDHDPKGSNQTARIYDTEIVADPDRLTAYGKPYKFLRGKAYTVRTDENKSLIAEIDAGIKKEVSVSCSANSKICSICGAEQHNNACEHIKGREYDGKLCYHTLDDIADAYEWSFVAVPAQVGAGVTKKFDKKEGKNMDFEPITTKDALDEFVNKAVAEKTSALEKELETLRTQLTERDSSIADLTAKNAAFETAVLKSKIAREYGIPDELADRISGADEDEFRADAERLAKFFTRHRKAAPLFMGGDGEMSGVEKEFYKKNPDLKH